MNSRIGTILATVTILLIAAACCIPRSSVKWKIQMPIEGDRNGGERVAVAEDRKESAKCRFDQNPVKGISEAGAGKITKCRQEPEIVAEPGLGISIDASIEIGLTLSQRLEHAS